MTNRKENQEVFEDNLEAQVEVTVETEETVEESFELNLEELDSVIETKSKSKEKKQKTEWEIKRDQLYAKAKELYSKEVSVEVKKTIQAMHKLIKQKKVDSLSIPFKNVNRRLIMYFDGSVPRSFERVVREVTMKRIDGDDRLFLDFETAVSMFPLDIKIKGRENKKESTRGSKEEYFIIKAL